MKKFSELEKIRERIFWPTAVFHYSIYLEELRKTTTVCVLARIRTRQVPKQVRSCHPAHYLV
jgi:hypothetical protein